MLHAEDVAAACVFAVDLPPRAFVPELTILPTALQAIGKTTSRPEAGRLGDHVLELPRAAGVEALDHVHAELAQQRRRSPASSTYSAIVRLPSPRAAWISDSRITRSDGLVALWRTNSPSILR